MKNTKRIATIIQMAARIWASLILLFLVFFVGAHVIEALFGPEGASDDGFNSVGEMLTFIFCFPVGTMIGLAIAWKWEGLGGLITVGGIICLFIMRSDLITNPYFIIIGINGLLFLVYWVLIRGRQLETIETEREQTKTKRKNVIIAVLISCIPLGAFMLFMALQGGGSYITSEKDSAYNKKADQVEVIVTIEDPLVSFFAHSFEHSLVSGFEMNGIESMVTINATEPKGLTENGERARSLTTAPTLRINIKPHYRIRDDGYKAIVGTDYEASLIDIENEKRVWQATGKVDYIAMFSDYFEDGEDIRKEFAWSTAAAIVNAFVEDVNGQKPAKIYTDTEARQQHGQRID